MKAPNKKSLTTIAFNLADMFTFTSLSKKIRSLLWLGPNLLLLGLIPLANAESTTAPTCAGENLSDEVKLECLFPSEEALIEGSPQSGSTPTSLPHGNLTEDFLPFFINTGLTIAGTLIFVAFLYAGYLLVFVNDNEENIEKGKKTLIYAVIGAFVMAISYAVIYGIANLDLD